MCLLGEGCESVRARQNVQRSHKSNMQHMCTINHDKGEEMEVAGCESVRVARCGEKMHTLVVVVVDDVSEEMRCAAPRSRNAPALSPEAHFSIAAAVSSLLFLRALSTGVPSLSLTRRMESSASNRRATHSLWPFPAA